MAARLGAALSISAALLSLSACASDREIAERSVKAFELHQAAAERGDQNAAAALGGIYLRGAGTDQDTAKALFWLERAGPRGWYGIGAIYDKGLGVPPDVEKAAEYYRKAAERGDDPLAMYRLGTLYAEDRLARRDNLEGYVWLLLAERIGRVSPGCRNLSHWCNEHAIKDVPGHRAKLRNRLSAEDLVEADRRATEWEMTFKRGRGR